MKSRILNKLMAFCNGYKMAFEDFFNCSDAFIAKFLAVVVFLFFLPVWAALTLVLLFYLLINYTGVVLLFLFMITALIAITRILDNYYKNPKNK